MDESNGQLYTPTFVADEDPVNSRLNVDVIYLYIHILAYLGVPGYGDEAHPYNVVNLAFYLPDRSWLADATEVWDNPGKYMTSTFKRELTGSSSASNSQLRTAIKRT